MANRNLLIDIGEDVRFDAAFLGTGMSITNSGKTITLTSAVNALTRSQRPRTAGKLVFGAKVNTGYAAIGVGTQYVSATNTYPGAVADSWGVYCNNPGTAKWGYWTHGPSTDVAASANGDWLFVAADLPNGKIWLGHAPAATPTVVTWVGGGNPATNTSPTFSDLNTSGTFVENQIRKFYVMAGAFSTIGNGLQLITDYLNLSAAMSTLFAAGWTPWGEIAFLSARGTVTQPNDSQWPAGGLLARYYDPRIRADGDPEYTRAASVWTFGTVSKPTPPIQQIDFENGDGGLDFLIPMNLRDVPITGWLYNLGYGRDEAPDSSGWIRAFTMIGDQVQTPNEQTLRVLIKDKLGIVDKPVQAAVYPATTPNTALVGQPRVFGMGFAQYVPLTTYDAPNLEFDLGFQLGAVNAVYDQGVAITLAAGWASSRSAAVDGVVRLTNPAGKQVATANLNSVLTPVAGYVTEPFSAWSGGAPGNYFATVGANCTLTNPSGTTAQLNCTVAAGANNVSTLQVANAPGSGTYMWFEIVVTAVTSGKCEVVIEPGLNAVTAGSANVVMVIDRPGTYRYAFVKGSANRVFGIQWGKVVCNIQISGAAVYTASTSDGIQAWATELFVNRGGLLPADIDSGGTIATLASQGYTLCWWQQATNANILDIFQAALDAHTGAYWQDRFGVIKVGRLVDPAPLSGSAVATFDSTTIFGDVTPRDDDAAGLSTSLAGVPVWGQHQPSEIAGSVLLTALGAQLQSAYLSNVVGSSAVDSFYAAANARPPKGTVLSQGTFVTTEANRVTSIYSTKRQFWEFQAFMVDTSSYSIEPFQIILLAITDRYGITTSKPLLVISATSRFLSDLVSFVCWG